MADPLTLAQALRGQVNTPTMSNQQTGSSLLGALQDPQFYGDIRQKLTMALRGGLQDVFPTGPNPGSSVAQAFPNQQTDPQYLAKMLNLGIAGMTTTPKAKISLTELPDLIENGLHTEYPEVAGHLFDYTQNMNRSSLYKAQNSEEYGAYSDSLKRLLRAVYPSGTIPVSRVEGYAGAGKNYTTGPISVSINPNWGNASEKAGKKVIRGNIAIDDVIAAGNVDEGEFITKGGSIK